MSRSYSLGKRAEQQAETRRRIVEAAVELHGELGPARTPLSLIAERAGVQRKTLYAHFPDERSLQLACSGLAVERDPLPDPEEWRDVADEAGRLDLGLGALYAYFERNSALLASVLRDSEHHALTRETIALRFGPRLTAIAEVLGAGLSPEQRAMLPLAMSFHSWRTLASESGMTSAQAAAAMRRAVLAAGGERPLCVSARSR